MLTLVLWYRIEYLFPANYPQSSLHLLPYPIAAAVVSALPLSIYLLYNLNKIYTPVHDGCYGAIFSFAHFDHDNAAKSSSPTRSVSGWVTRSTASKTIINVKKYVQHTPWWHGRWQLQGADHHTSYVFLCVSGNICFTQWGEPASTAPNVYATP